MANKMATMQGCCCTPVGPLVCTEFALWWNGRSAVILPDLVFANNAGCPECTDMNGGYVLDRTLPFPLGCSNTGASMAHTFSTPFAPCVGPVSLTGLRFSALCYKIDDITYVEYLLYLAHGFGSSSCRAFANTVFPITSPKLLSGSLTPKDDFPGLSSCGITGTIEYEVL